MSSPTIFFAYSDIPWRRQVLYATNPLPDSYIFYGMPELLEKGYNIRHNLEKPASRWSVVLNTKFNSLWSCLGGYGGDWHTVVTYLSVMNQSSLIFSTSDRVGIPLTLLSYWGALRPPILYTSVGLLERLEQLHNRVMWSMYYHAFRKIPLIICYGFEEAERLRNMLKMGESRIRFIPFAVQTDMFYPMSNAEPTVDIISVGADPYRDFSLLIKIAERHPELSVRIVTNASHAARFKTIPLNVDILIDIPLNEVKSQLTLARIVVLPLVENSYSGATTTLLQAMAMAKPVVVSAVGAIKYGYHLQNDVNCKLVEPKNVLDLEEAIHSLLSNSELARSIGDAARQLVIERNSWQEYTNTLVSLFKEIPTLYDNQLI